jgi:hypothetical protein
MRPSRGAFRGEACAAAFFSVLLYSINAQSKVLRGLVLVTLFSQAPASTLKVSIDSTSRERIYV